MSVKKEKSKEEEIVFKNSNFKKENKEKTVKENNSNNKGKTVKENNRNSNNKEKTVKENNNNGNNKEKTVKGNNNNGNNKEKTVKGNNNNGNNKEKTVKENNNNGNNKEKLVKENNSNSNGNKEKTVKENNSNGNNKVKNNKNKSQKNNVLENQNKKIANEKEKLKEKIEKKEILQEKKALAKTKKAEIKVKNNSSKKRLIIILLITIILVFLLIFSTCFALAHIMSNTIARGISIKNVDVSNLTYNEAKEKLEEVFDISLDININLKYEDFSYIVTSTDIALSYDLTEALEEAYNIGRSEGILKNNFDLIYTAICNKNIDVLYEYDDDSLNTIVEYVSTNIPNLVKQYSYYIEGSELIITPGSDGIDVNEDLLKSQIIDNINNRNLNEISAETTDEELEIPYTNIIADTIDIEAIYNEVKQDPQDAYYVEATETTEFQIYTDVDGIDFAISLEEAEAIIATEGLEEYVIPLTITEAEVTINDIGIEAFTYEVSTFSTTYDASNTSRSENLRIAASKINGTVVMPGEQFSFNEVVGERTVSEGYQNAAVYSDGQVVDGLAGGICQISSTLYNVVLLANLQVDERYNHSFTTSYVEAGRDATVVYGTKDFKFTNTRTYPIKIEATVADGVATFSIYGIEEETEYTVKIIPVKTETTPYTTQTITDTTLASGTTVVSQAGASGCKVTTYKEVYLNNVMISRETISNDTYQVMTRIIRVGASTE